MVAVLILSVSSSGVTGLWQVSRVAGAVLGGTAQAPTTGSSSASSSSSGLRCGPHTGLLGVLR